jgi:hypothetical protein
VSTQIRRPIDAWPAKRFSGRPGYSAKYFAAMAGAPTDPLRVAERIASRRIGDEVSAEARAKLAGGDFSEVLSWQGRELTARCEAAWSSLCESFDCVSATLKSVPATAEIKRLLREVTRAERQGAALLGAKKDGG